MGKRNMKPNIHFEDDDEFVKNIRQQAKKAPDAALRDKMENALEEFRHSLNFHPCGESRSKPSYVLEKIRGHKFIAGRIAAAAIVIIPLLTFVFLFTESATYAQVNEQFKTVPYFRATLYIKENFSSKPIKIDLWIDNGRSRALTETQVIFGRNGMIENAYDIVKNVNVAPDDIAADIIERIGLTRTFSLETLLDCVSLNNVQDLTFSAKPCPLAGELTIFDKQPAPGDDENIRIWALQKSKLPVQVNIANGPTTVDILLVYSEKQSDAFFDSQAFAAKKDQSDYSPQQLAYLFYNTVADVTADK